MCSFITASAFPSGYNLYMFGRYVREVLINYCDNHNLDLYKHIDSVEIVWGMGNVFSVELDKAIKFECICSHNRTEFFELLKSAWQSNDVCDKFDKENRYTVYVGQSNIHLSLTFDGSDFKFIDVKLKNK